MCINAYNAPKEDLIKALTHALESQVTEANKKLIAGLEQSLQSLENQYIREDLEKKASFTLLEDERPSKAFLNMESRKASLRILKPIFLQ